MELYTKLQQADPFFLIAGPCVIEDRDTMLKIAEFLAELAFSKDLALIFKSSFIKANRSSGDSPRGPGIDEGLAMLAMLKEQFGFPILTDVHESTEAPVAAEICEVLQIPAFLSRQTALINAAADTGRIVNIKKGQFMAPEDMASAAAKASERGNTKILLTERGTSFGYHDLVVDFRGFADMAATGYPVIYDVTHSLQKPSAGKVSGGNPEYAEMMARAALATNQVRGLFIETHPEPQIALSDASSMLSLGKLPALIDSCLSLYKGYK
jgi:2-dehydro-3-deoxyphosphooctonate aldolase (KDO 8-P synthase)